MKCPKCHYLGFETGDRCKNCGYDFSLLTVDDSSEPVRDLLLRPGIGVHNDQSDGKWGEPEIELRADVPGRRLELGPREESGPPAAGHRIGPAVSPDDSLPLFAGAPPDDEPVLRAPSGPHRPMAVRPLQEPPPPVRPERVARESGRGQPHVTVRESPAAMVPAALTPMSELSAECASCEARPRVTAAMVDLAVLSCVDVVVMYLTLRMAMLTLAEWRLLPLSPLIVFLALIRIGYFSAFAAIGGQTIGKMVAGIRVVTEDGKWLSPGRAIQRTLAATVSFVTLGAAFAPALIGSRLALHDRVTRTRVVALPA